MYFFFVERTIRIETLSRGGNECINEKSKDLVKLFDPIATSSTSMRFLLKLVSCCGPIGCGLVGPSAKKAGSFMQVSYGGGKRNRGSKLSGRNVKPPAQWQPSLCTISEDDDVIKVEKEEDIIRPGDELMKNMGGSKAKSQACIRWANGNCFKFIYIYMYFVFFVISGKSNCISTINAFNQSQQWHLILMGFFQSFFILYNEVPNVYIFPQRKKKVFMVLLSIWIKCEILFIQLNGQKLMLSIRLCSY